MDVEKEMKKVAILGAGLSGLAAAFELSKNDHFQIEIFEQGKNYEERRSLVQNDASHNIMGIGGAGTLGGGKLCMPPASSYLWRKTALNSIKWKEFSRFILNLLKRINIEALNNTNSTVESKSMCADFVQKRYKTILLLKDEMSSLISRIIVELEKRKNVHFYPCHSIQSIAKEENIFNLFFANQEKITKKADLVILATGRSSAPHIETILKQLKISATLPSPDLGARVLTDLENAGVFEGYGQDQKIKIIKNNYIIRTFCVCNGGHITKVKIGNGTYYDGEFGTKKSSSVNFGIMLRSNHIKGITSALDYINSFNGKNGIGIDMKTFLMKPHSLIKDEYYNEFGIVVDAIKYFVLSLNKKKLLSDNFHNFKIVFPSIDHYNPIIKTNEGFETKINNLFVVGDAAGISRGYIQAFWSGWTAAKYILRKIQSKYIN